MLHDIVPDSHIAIADRLSQALDIVAGNSFDLIILDLNIPGGGTPAMIRDLLSLQQDARILVFSAHDERVYALPCLQAGASGYLSKNAPDDEFALAVKTVLGNNRYLSNDMQQQLLRQITHAPGKGPESNPAHVLSARETEVMQLLLQGMGTAEIAARIHLQLSTISTYKMKIFEKMGVRNIVELVEKMKLYNR